MNQIFHKKLELILGWCVHLLTASSAVIALYGFQAVLKQDFRLVLIFLVITIILDAIDGPLARVLKVKENIPNFDGALLDYIVDFVSWVVLPAFVILQSDFFTQKWRVMVAIIIVLSSCYQFCCTDLKDKTSTFKRWPSAWSIVVICLFLWTPTIYTSLFFIFLLALLSFVPVFFIHSLRLDLTFTKFPLFDRCFCIALIIISVLFNCSLLYSVWIYPDVQAEIKYFQIFCVTGYFLLSFYQTLFHMLAKRSGSLKF